MVHFFVLDDLTKPQKLHCIIIHNNIRCKHHARKGKLMSKHSHAFHNVIDFQDHLCFVPVKDGAKCRRNPYDGLSSRTIH